MSTKYTFTPLEAASFLGLSVSGCQDIAVDRAEQTSAAGPGCVTWFKTFQSKHTGAVMAVKGALIVTPLPSCVEEHALLNLISVGNAVISTPEPRLAFARLLGHFFGHLEARIPAGIDPRACVDPTAVIGENVTIGPFCFVGEGASIGDNTIMHPGAVVHSRSLVGRNCILNSNCVIGGRGFGFIKRHDGVLEHFPQIGIVVLEDDVEVGACTAIDRPGLGETRLKKGTKVDNVVHIAHNAVIGPDAAIIAGAEVGASVIMEQGSWLGPNACSIENIRIGRNAFVGIGATVLKDVADDQVVAGNPAEPIEVLRRNRKAIKKLVEQDK
jgi:UDP-3-O-[3-hydroxymyristoyl] glucosamine N-acyltransferase